ncbi:hypothetical protein PPACK8108_LOCUS18728 [Phakopsora pachyrhizi]|uniref:NADH dehydrogenase [ubiquinone] 1 alpha subcomplex subunit n=1 Tax=Phakopsora pachyrhizi TaxID=170000 RepID=A0AAV0BFA7_PHAPC|nr:hypothetical protein PPACK8108_LOCUS18728 [Phakopsora pachyrhizi]
MVRSLAKFIKQRLGLGKERFYVGSDLHRNRYYEEPISSSILINAIERTRPRRYVDFYNVLKDLDSHRFQNVPPQWLSWLSFTRKTPPTIQELEADRFRQVRLKENVTKLLLAEQHNKSLTLENDQTIINEINKESASDRSDLNQKTTSNEEEEEEVERKRSELNKSPLTAFNLSQKPPNNSSTQSDWKPKSWNPQPISKN